MYGVRGTFSFSECELADCLTAVKLFELCVIQMSLKNRACVFQYLSAPVFLSCAYVLRQRLGAMPSLWSVDNDWSISVPQLDDNAVSVNRFHLILL